MGHGHSHGSKEDGDNADGWTWASTVTEAFSGFLANAAFFAPLIDLGLQTAGVIDEHEEKYLGFSLPALVVAPALSIFATIGSAYSHYNLNKLYQLRAQQSANQCPHTTDADHSSNQIKPTSSLDDSSDEESLTHQHQQAQPSAKIIVHQEKEVSPSNQLEDEEDGKLTWEQKVALVGDAITHVGEVSAPTGIIAFALMKNVVSLPIQCATQSAIILYGLMGCWADVRTCKNSMRQENKKHKATMKPGYEPIPDSATQIQASDVITITIPSGEEKSIQNEENNVNSDKEEEKADTITYLGLITEISSSFIADAFWVGMSADFCLQAMGILHDNYRKFGDQSVYGLIIGATFALFTTGTSAYAHFILNTSNQSDKKSSKKKIDALPLTTGQKAIAVGEFFSHAGDRAAPLGVITSVDAFSNASPVVKLAAQGVILVYGMFGGYAGYRACIQNLKENNAREAARHHRTLTP